MAFSIEDALIDVPELLMIVQKIEAGLSALPKPAKASDITALVASVLPAVGTLIDTVKTQMAAGTAPSATPATPKTTP